MKIHVGKKVLWKYVLDCLNNTIKQAPKFSLLFLVSWAVKYMHKNWGAMVLSKLLFCFLHLVTLFLSSLVLFSQFQQHNCWYSPLSSYCSTYITNKFKFKQYLVKRLSINIHLVFNKLSNNIETKKQKTNDFLIHYNQ